MKTTTLLALAAALALPALARADIVGSPHDFSGETWNVKNGDKNTVCGVCHQPHNAASATVPLWGHTTTISTFKMYTSPSMDATTPSDVGNISRACLSCHDGTVAVNSYAGGIQGPTSIMISNKANLGTDLSHSHPISFSYNEAQGKDGFLKDSSAAILTPDSGTGSGTFNTGGKTSIKDFLLNGGDNLECSTCHDVHNQLGMPFDITQNPKLVKIVGTQDGKGSLLCRSCHIK
jgi:hypothetical protein